MQKQIKNYKIHH